MDKQSCVRLFADDTSLYIIADNPTSASEKINADFEIFIDELKNG